MLPDRGARADQIDQQPEKRESGFPATASKDEQVSRRTRRTIMNHYQISVPRKIFALGAVAMTAITIALSVVVPAQVKPGDRSAQALAAAKAIAPAEEAVAERLHVKVVGVREPELISVHGRPARVKPKQES